MKVKYVKNYGKHLTKIIIVFDLLVVVLKGSSKIVYHKPPSFYGIKIPKSDPLD